MAMEEEERRIAPDIVVSDTDLDQMSIDELEKRITLLEAEIVRLRHNIDQKSQSKASAENFFKK